MWTTVPSPLGPLTLLSDPQGAALTAIEFADHGEEATPRSSTAVAAARALGRQRGERSEDSPVLVETRRQLDAYFAGDLTHFDVPLAPLGTDFQQRVWQQLRSIEYGRTASYGEIARQLGMTGHGSRAVGLANGRNPIPVVVPCHRVVGADGSLTGYAGGIDRKRRLLQLEALALF